ASTAHGRKQTDLVAGVQPLIGLDVVVSHGEEREGAVLGERGMAVNDRLPRAFDGTVVGKIELESLLPGGFTIPGEETNPDPQFTAQGAPKWPPTPPTLGARRRSRTRSSTLVHPTWNELSEPVRLAAAAARLHVRVLDREPGAHHVVGDEVDLATAQV